MIIYSEPKVAAPVPIIDLAGTFDGDGTARERAAAEIGTACRDTGFFYLTNHGIDPALIEGAFAQANRFFDQPDHWKAKLRKQPGTNGYEPPETQRLDNDSPGDIKESYNFSQAGPAGSPDTVANLWPEDLPGFRSGVEDYYQPLAGLGLHISRLIALSLGMDFHHFDGTFKTQKAPLRLLRYPPQPANAKPNQLGAGAHTDWGWITLLVQDGHGGLEVENAAGDWVRAEPIPGTIIVNLGDIILRWTNGRYHSSLHRVMNNRSGQDRHSMVLFFNQSHDTHVEALPTCLEPGEAAKYPPCTSGEHTLQRYHESRGGLLAGQ